MFHIRLLLILFMCGTPSSGLHRERILLLLAVQVTEQLLGHVGQMSC
jgi:hypothetical protein